MVGERSLKEVPWQARSLWDTVARTVARVRDGTSTPSFVGWLPCGKFEGLRGVLGRAREYKDVGRDEWLRRRAREASRGFEHHTGKYYRSPIARESDED